MEEWQFAELRKELEEFCEQFPGVDIPSDVKLQYLQDASRNLVPPIDVDSIEMWFEGII